MAYISGLTSEYLLENKKVFNFSCTCFCFNFAPNHVRLVFAFIILRQILEIMKAKFSSQVGHFRRFFPIDVCQFRSRSKFAVEFDWNKKNLKTLKILVFFEKRWFFRKQNLILFEIPKNGKIVAECVSNGNFCLKCLFCPNHEVFFLQKVRKL